MTQALANNLWEILQIGFGQPRIRLGIRRQAHAGADGRNGVSDIGSVLFKGFSAATHFPPMCLASLAGRRRFGSVMGHHPSPSHGHRWCLSVPTVAAAARTCNWKNPAAFQWGVS